MPGRLVSSPAAPEGVFAAVPSAWRDDGRFDADTFGENTRRLIGAGVDGVYTTGTDGEWYAFEFASFRELVDAFAAASAGFDVGTQVGCTWINLEGTIRRVSYAVDAGISDVQLALPPWLPLRDDEVVRFFAAVAGAVPEARLIHYNTRFSKTFVQGDLYRRIAAEVPAVVGTKFVGTLDELSAALELAPTLAHFTHEEAHVAGRFLGASGVYTWLAPINPPLSLRIRDACRSGDWDTALNLQSRVNAFARALGEFEARGYSPAAVAHAVGEISGFLVSHGPISPPHSVIPDDERRRLERRLRESFPDVLWS